MWKRQCFSVQDKLYPSYPPCAFIPWISSSQCLVESKTRSNAVHMKRFWKCSSFTPIVDNVLFHASVIVIPLEAKKKVTFPYSVIFLEFLILKRKPKDHSETESQTKRSPQNKRRRGERHQNCGYSESKTVTPHSQWMEKCSEGTAAQVMWCVALEMAVCHVEYFLLSCFLVLIPISFTVNCSEMYSYPGDSWNHSFISSWLISSPEFLSEQTHKLRKEFLSIYNEIIWRYDPETSGRIEGSLFSTTHLNIIVWTRRDLFTYIFI